MPVIKNPPVKVGDVRDTGSKVKTRSLTLYEALIPILSPKC